MISGKICPKINEMDFGAHLKPALIEIDVRLCRIKKVRGEIMVFPNIAANFE